MISTEHTFGLTPLNQDLKIGRSANSFIEARIFSFTAAKQDGRDLLQWNASVTPSLQQFQIERSENGIDFYSMDSIASKIVSGDFASYEFYSPDMVSGTRYYRLKIVYTNGVTDYSSAIKVDDDMMGRVVMLYNSPKQFTLQTPYLLKAVNVMDANGQVIIRYTDIPAGTKRINMETFTSGVYWIQCISDRTEIIKVMSR